MTEPQQDLQPQLQQDLQRAGVHSLLVQFTDLHGCAKGKLVPLQHLDDVLRLGAGFAGPSIWGTGLPRTGPRAEYYARGDASTAQPLPWLPGVARIVGDGFVGGQPFDACPRQVLHRALARLKARGWSLRTGIEPEFFLLKQGAHGQWLPADDHDRLDKPSYDLKSLPRQMGFLHELQQTLQALGMDVLQIDHEDAHSQFEVNFAYGDALLSADRVMLFKLAAHALAEARGMVFSMMPKPFANQPGSGLHFHVSLWAGEKCLFDPGPEDGGHWRGAGAGAEAAPGTGTGTGTGTGNNDLSRLGRQFIAGVLHHANALCALAAPTVNSYKRLTVGESLSGTTWAPAYVAHGPNNRTAMVRTLPGRFEWRVPDASANPYLVTAALIAAGLDGIDRQLDPGPACTDDLFDWPLARIRQAGIGLLPQSLDAALDALQSDHVVSAALGPTLTAEFIRLKRAEWTAYARHVSGWEMDRYAALF